MDNLNVLHIIIGWIIAIPAGYLLIKLAEYLGNSMMEVVTGEFLGYEHEWTLYDSWDQFPFIRINRLRPKGTRIITRIVLVISMPVLAVIFIAIFALEFVAAIALVILCALFRVLRKGWESLID